MAHASQKTRAQLTANPRLFNELLNVFTSNTLEIPAAYRFPSNSDDEPREMQSAQPRILIVEDNALNMKLLRDLLEASGYETIATAEGGAALALARVHQPALILMDLQLPDISGFEAVKQLKADAQTRAIPVVAVTAFALLGDEEKALASGCDGYVSKPIALGDFLDKVRRFIGVAGDRGKA